MNKSSKSLSCPKCSSKEIVKKGIRKNKLQQFQQYLCKNCSKIFTENKNKNKTYPISLILKAISLYNLNFTLEQIKQKLKTEASLPTILNWIKEYKEVAAFSRLRGELKNYSDQDIIQQHTFLHNNLPYKFQIHIPKLNLLFQDTKFNDHCKFLPIRDYLNKIPTSQFPHHIFKPKPEVEEKSDRASQSSFATLNIKPLQKQNLANTLCKLALNLAKTNKERHQAIQDFMLANDSVTIASEVPIYLTHDDLLYFNSHGFSLNPNDFSTPVTGYIDILQIRNNLIHVLDYKPDANKERPIHQLTIYALALASKTKLPLTLFKCAWFNENNYFEFFPLHTIKEKSQPIII